MSRVLPHCPNPNCTFSAVSASWKYVKKGFFLIRHNGQRVRRYQCAACLRTFSSHTFKTNYRMRKPYINDAVAKLLCASVSQRRTARLLGVDPKTVARRLVYLAGISRKQHELAVVGLRDRNYQFDEMESFEHTKCKPLSIALAVAADKKKIIGLRVAEMPAKGKLAAINARQPAGRS